MEKEDRRVRRTKKLLKQGLSELMREKDFKDISIKDITDRMDLNRGTFYLHYTDIYDLLEKIEMDELNDFQSMIDDYIPKASPKSLMPILEPLADYIVDNNDICKILFENQASQDFTLKFKKLIIHNGNTIIKERLKEIDPELVEYYFDFITYGIIGMLKKWLSSENPINKKTLVTLCDKIISAASSSILQY